MLSVFFFPRLQSDRDAEVIKADEACHKAATELENGRKTKGRAAWKKQREAFGRRRAERADAWAEQLSIQVRSRKRFFKSADMSLSVQVRVFLFRVWTGMSTVCWVCGGYDGSTTWLDGVLGVAMTGQAFVFESGPGCVLYVVWGGVALYDGSTACTASVWGT